MKRALSLAILAPLFLVSIICWGQDERPTAEHVARTVARLHDEMLNPPTFVLDAVYLSGEYPRLAVNEDASAFECEVDEPPGQCCYS